LQADVQPKATDHIKEMIGIIEELERKGYTYVIEDGVYYDVSKFKAYGKLSKQKMEKLKDGIRVRVNIEKRSPHDFVLWKFSKPGEPKWSSPWGEGRPGWHIECSAMSSKYLGDTFDIHGGGADLTFPHHECEIAQSEAFSGKILANYWMHNGFIQINNEKMSKSLGNFFTLRDIFKKFDPQVVRFMYLQTHYRSPIDFSDEILTQSKNGLMRLHDFMQRLQNYEPKDENSNSIGGFLEKNKGQFETAMEDDFETPKALSAIFDLVKEINRCMDSKSLSENDKEILLKYLLKIDGVLGILMPTASNIVDQDVENLINERNSARSKKDFRLADKIRDELLEKGIQLEDFAEGTKWKKI
jgi:cysteinyl-tRNA synthetase